MTIVKVQIPLATNDPTMPALIYDARRKHLVQQQLDANTRLAMGHDYKAFFEANWDGQQWKLVSRVGLQPW